MLNKSLLSRDYFKKRILQSVKCGPKVDDDINEIYFKSRKNIYELIKSDNFDTLCKEIFNICNRPFRSIKANQIMKSAINEITFRFAKKEEKLALKGKKCLIGDFIRVICEVAEDRDINFKDLRDKLITKEVMVKYVNDKLSAYFPSVKGDQVIQIGTVFWRFGDDNPFYSNMISLGNCSDFGTTDVISCNNESDVLLEWTNLIEKTDPDIILGYNTLGFDEIFISDRSEELFTLEKKNKKKMIRIKTKLHEKFINMGRLHKNIYDNIYSCKGGIIEKKLASSALGTNYLHYFNMPGRVQIDLLKVVQGGLTKLPSYKLDSVAEFYISGKIVDIGLREEKEEINLEESNWITIKNIKELELGNYIIITTKTGEQVKGGEKIIIEEIDYENNRLKLKYPVPTRILSDSPVWGVAKDDVGPKDIFRLQKGSDDDRAIVAKYCIQDCALVIRLLRKLDTIPNNFGMSNVCLVPFSYIFLRGQGIKIFSLVVNECCLNGFLLPVLDKVDKTGNNIDTIEIDEDNPLKLTEYKYKKEVVDEDNDSFNIGSQSLDDNFNVIEMSDDGYEGAIVLTPKPDIYTKDPITVLDFSSLYPSEMIASNLSHDSHCENKMWLGDEGAKRLKKLGYDYIDREYDVYSLKDPNNKNKGKHKTGVKVERFVQYPDEKKGLIPMIEQKLLGARKATKKRMKVEKDPFKASILDGLQLAYKVTANSLYGQIGASTSKIYKKAIAASITAGGRNCIYRARDYCLENNPGCEVVYGDTDSVFVKFNLQYENGTYPETDVEKVQRSIDIGMYLQDKLKKDKFFTPPHDLEYEKVFYPLMLITKKRYAGEKFEFDAKESKFTSMGLVLKRRDNAPILKYIYYGVTNCIMKEKNILKSIKYIEDNIIKILENKFDLNMFIISKTLKDFYKDPESVPHKVLAERMGQRDPGNKPSSNERIPYAFIKIKETPGKDTLLGDRIEHINYIKDNKLALDYYIYIEKQLMKPISQIFELVVEQIKGYPFHKDYFHHLYEFYYKN